MREFVTDDLITNLRVTRQVSFTKRGLVTKSFTQFIPNEDDEQTTVADKLQFDIPDYVNYNNERSTSEGAGYYVYDYIREIHDDGHEIIIFNTSVEMHFDITRACDANCMTDYFYFKQNIRDASISEVSIRVKDDYTEGAIANLYIDSNIVSTINLSPTESDTYNGEIVNLPEDLPTDSLHKIELIIVGNTDANARAEVTISFDSEPDNYEHDEDEEVTEDA